MVKENVIRDNQTNTVEIFTHNTTGAANSGFGVGIEYPFAWEFRASTSTTDGRLIGRIYFEWEVAIDATRQSVAVIEIVAPDFRGENRLVEVVRCYADGRIVKDEDVRGLRR